MQVDHHFISFSKFFEALTFVSSFFVLYISCFNCQPTSLCIHFTCLAYASATSLICTSSGKEQDQTHAVACDHKPLQKESS